MGPRPVPRLRRGSDEVAPRWPDASRHGWRQGERRMVADSDADGGRQTAMAAAQERREHQTDLEKARRSIGENRADDGADSGAERCGVAVEPRRRKEANAQNAD